MQSNGRWVPGLLVVVLGAAALLVGAALAPGLLNIRVDLGFPGPAPASTAASTPGLGASLLASQTAGPGASVAALPKVATPPAAPTPAVAPGTVVQYTVQPGDTLSGIAAQYGTTVEALQARNGITDPSLIFAGSVLQVRAGEQTPAQAAAQTPAQAAAPSPTPGGASGLPPLAPPATRPAAPLVGAATPAPLDALEPTHPAQPPAAYDVYIPTASKAGQYFHFTCEFDAAWAIFKTYGLDVSLDEQLAIIGVDTSVVPSYKQTPQGIEIDGGDIANYYSGDYKTNFLARTTGAAMRKVFSHYGLATTPVHDQAGLENALRAGELVWIKTTVDFKRWVPATWVGPDGRRYGTVLGNDHAVVVAGFNASAVLIRDVLGPTSTNANRLEEYEVPWPTFLAAWGAQSDDGLAVARPAAP